MKKILVIGANGFIGRHLSDSLKNYNVVQATRQDFDLNDLDKMTTFFKEHNPNVVVNLAADKKRGTEFQDFRRMMDVNQIGTLNIVEAASQFSSIEHLIFIGSAEEYGDQKAPFTEDQIEKPSSAYAYSKTCSKHLLQALWHTKKTPFTYLRPTLVYGSGQGNEMFLPALIESLKANKKFQLTKGEQIRDFIHVSDVCRAIIAVIENKSKTLGQIYNVSNGETKSIKEVAELVADQLGKRDLLAIGAIPYRDKEIFDYRASSAKIEKDLGWMAQVGLEQGVSELLTLN